MDRDISKTMLSGPADGNIPRLAPRTSALAWTFLALFLFSCGGRVEETATPRKAAEIVQARHQVKINWEEREFAMESVRLSGEDGRFAVHALAVLGPALFTVCRDGQGAFSGRNLAPVLDGKFDPLWVAYDNWRMFGALCGEDVKPGECRVEDPLLGPVIVKEAFLSNGALEKREWFACASESPQSTCPCQTAGTPASPSQSPSTPSIVVTYGAYTTDALGLFPSRITLVHWTHGYTVDVLVTERKTGPDTDLDRMLASCR